MGGRRAARRARFPFHLANRDERPREHQVAVRLGRHRHYRAAGPVDGRRAPQSTQRRRTRLLCDRRQRLSAAARAPCCATSPTSTATRSTPLRSRAGRGSCKPGITVRRSSSFPTRGTGADHRNCTRSFGASCPIRIRCSPNCRPTRSTSIPTSSRTSARDWPRCPALRSTNICSRTGATSTSTPRNLILSDVRIRQCDRRSWSNWNRMNRDVYHGYNLRAVSDIAPGSWAAPHVAQFRYDRDDLSGPIDCSKVAGWLVGPYQAVFATISGRRCGSPFQPAQTIRRTRRPKCRCSKSCARSGSTSP